MNKPTKRFVQELQSLSGVPYTQDLFLSYCEWEVLKIYARRSLENRLQIYNEYAKRCEGGCDPLLVYLMGYVDGLSPLQCAKLLKQLEEK